MPRPTSFTNMQMEKNAQLKAEFEKKRKQLSVRKDNQMKKAMYEAVLKEYSRNLFAVLKDNRKEKIMEQISIAINRVIDSYPNMLSATDWKDVYKKVSEMDFWSQDLVRDRIKFHFLKDKIVMEEADDTEENLPTKVEDPVSKTINDLNEKVNDAAGVESLNTFINKKLNDKARMLVEGYYDLIVSSLKKSNKIDSWFMTL